MPLGIHPAFAQPDLPPPTPHNPQDTIKIQMFWPGDEDVVFRLNNHVYPFKANSIGFVGPQMKHQEDEQTGKLQFHKPLIPIPLVGAADQVATELKKMYEDQGLTLLYNDGFDEQRKAQGRAANVKFRMAEALQIVGAHQAACERAAANKLAAPAPSYAYRKALAFVNFHEQQLHTRNRYICQKDGMDFKTYTEFQAYVAENYPASIDDPSILFDSQAGKPHIMGDTDVPNVLPVKLEVRKVAEPTPAPAPEPPQIPEGDLHMMTLRAKARDILVEAAVNQITLEKDVLDVLSKGTDASMIELAIDEATLTIHGPQTE